MAVTPSTFEDWSRNLESYLYTADFVQSPNIYEIAKEGIGGWKIHVGLGISNASNLDERKKVVEVLQEIIELIGKYEKEIGAKFTGFRLMEVWSKHDNPQRGKQITVYIPEENTYLVPIISRHLKYILEKNKSKGLTLISSDPSRNILLDENGIISLRWSSYFRPRPGREEEIDDRERYQNPIDLTKSIGKYQELLEIYSLFKRLEKARYLDRFTVLEYLKRGEFNKLIGNIVVIPLEIEGRISYYAHLVEEITFKEGKYKLRVRGLEGPYRKLWEADIENISRTPEKSLKHKSLLTIILILVSVFLFSLSSNILNNISGSFTLVNSSVFVVFLFLFFISLVLGYNLIKK